MKFRTKAVVVAVMLIVCIGAGVFILKPSPICLSADGQLQDGRKYEATCKMMPTSSFPFIGDRSYTIRSLNFIMDGKSRSVPSNALYDIVVFDPAIPLKVAEEGPVVVLSLHTGENENPVQWRYLNGFFAQRRILNGDKIAIHNADARLLAPTMVSNMSPDAPRRLGSSSLLTTPDESPRTPLKNGHE